MFIPFKHILRSICDVSIISKLILTWLFPLCLCNSEGMRADFVVLDRSPLLGIVSWQASTAPKLLATFLDGACVHGCKAGRDPPWRAN